MLKAIFISILFVFLSITEAAATFCTKQGENGVTERICCAGYERNGTDCAYFCSNGCVNGKCTAPEFCECNEGFAKRGGRRSPCEPVPGGLQQQICHNRCINGTCSDGLCTCEEGWLLQQAESGEICVPQCAGNANNTSGGCVNGYCSAPGICVCFDSFEPLSTNTRDCISTMDASTWDKFFAIWSHYHWHIITVTITLIIVLLATCHLFCYKCRVCLYHRMEENQRKRRIEQLNKNMPFIAFMQFPSTQNTELNLFDS